VGGGVPIRTLRRSVACAFGAALIAATATTLLHGPHDGALVLAMLAPVGVATMLAAHVIARDGRLRRQFAAMAALIVLQLAVIVALMTAAMFVTNKDVFFTIVAAGYSAALGVWCGRLLERRALERLDAEERARRHLVAAVSHDLRTPITSLRLLAEAVEDELVDGAARRDYLRRIGIHVRALGSLIDDLFELTRLEAGDIRWGMDRIAVDELVRDTVDAMRPHAEAGAVRVAAELPPEGAVARTNPEQLQRVLFNLLQNAIRHTPRDGSVVVRAQPGNGVLEIEVADTGEGIALADRDRVFEPFVQGHARASRTDGSAGLGLAIARAIVEAHGGRIWLAEASTGTRVRFNLPAG
jgi:signal transduction histidine kinase